MTSHIFKARGLPDLRAGNRCVYHVGFLAIDRVEDSALDRAGKAFLELSEKGLVARFTHVEGYRLLSLMRASSVEKCHSAPA